MCKWGTDAPVTLNRAREHSGRTVIMVDACIAAEVQTLNDAGVWTLGCCCGHGKAPAHALVHSSSLMLVRFLGYDPQPYGETFEIQLGDNKACSICGQSGGDVGGEYPCLACGRPTMHDPVCEHVWLEEYYGTRCIHCALFYPHGSAPWDAPVEEVQ